VEILYLLIPVSILLVFVIGAIFWWALNNRQFDGLDEEANRIFLDDEIPTADSSGANLNAPKVDAPKE